MSNPAEGPALTPRPPVGARVPALAGDCSETRLVVSTSNSVVAVAASRSLLVYAAPVTPRAVEGGVAGLVRVPSAVVLGSAGSSMLWRRFWPVSLMTRRRLAAGLKSTPKCLPMRATVSCETFTAPALSSTV